MDEAEPSTLPVAAPEIFDIVVVGGGGSGLAAAIEARAAGCSVVLLEKVADLGGSTAWSVGSVSATGTPHQRRKGIEDSPENHWSDMALFNSGNLSGRDNADLRRVLCDEAPDMFRWLMESGIRFYGPMPEPPHRVPRMHNVLPNSKSFIYHLGRRARRAGVDIRLSTQVENLRLSAGRLVGVQTLCDGRRGVFLARRGVILAAGDFSNSQELKARYMGPREAKVPGLNIHATGDGQRLAMPLGATIVNGDQALGPEIRFVPPKRKTVAQRLPPWPLLASFMQWAIDHAPSALLRPFIMSFLTTALAPSTSLFANGAVLVNKAGERFCDELGQPAFSVAEQPGQVAYILLDDRVAKLYSAWPNFISTAPGIAYAYLEDYRRNRSDIFTQANTLGELAGKLSMPAAALAETVRARGEEQYSPAQGATMTRAFGAGPYIALGPVRSVFVHNEGGLRVNMNLQVLDADGVAVPGLFAAGSNGQGGLLLRGHGHHLAWAFVSGRRAGRLAAAEPVCDPE